MQLRSTLHYLAYPANSASLILIAITSILVSIGWSTPAFGYPLLVIMLTWLLKFGHSPASSWPIEFASGSSISGAAVTDNWSLKQLWERALSPSPCSGRSQCEIAAGRPSMHRNSRVNTLDTSGSRSNQPRRSAREIFDGRGLYLLVMPNGRRYGRYNYLFGGKLRTIALGVHPDVSLEKARTRHQVARTMLADGIDPSARKRATGVGIFGPLSPAGGA